MKARLDHIILLVAHETLLNPPTWVTDNFTLAPGGKHADGKTENKLILFQDGSYLELIAFVNDDQKAKEGHWWGKKRNGLIDWAVTFPVAAEATESSNNAEDVGKRIDEHFEELSKKLSDAQQSIKGDDTDKFQLIKYKDPATGGRILADGSEIKWKVAFPRTGKHEKASSDDSGDVGTGNDDTDNMLAMPFICYDITPRERRVPILDEKLLQHPCGAKGIDQVGLLMSKDEREQLGLLIGVISNSTQKPEVSRELYTTTRLELDAPRKIPGGSSTVVLMTPLTKPESERLEKYGSGFLAELSLRVDKDEKKITTMIEQDGVIIRFNRTSSDENTGNQGGVLRMA